ncbi:MAG: FAD-dependent oxidoreductase, partial [bacterium]|nr:FAD-dependent oxidoreductase [bacterium]
GRGYVTQRLIDYYEERARGGVGLIIVEGCCIDYPQGQGPARQMSIDNDRYVDGLGQLAAAIKRHGARVAVQLQHSGRDTKVKFTGLQPVAPSPIGTPWGDQPRELSLAEIAQVVDRFAAAARRAKLAGFDGVELNSGHGYLLAQFLSPAGNKRRDAYGGSLENRARLLLEAISAIRSAVGPDYPLWCRLNAQEFGLRDGLTLEDTQQVARWAEQAGVHAIHVSAYGYGSQGIVNLPSVPGALLPLAQAIKSQVSVPVIAVGRLTPQVAEKALEQGQADFVAVGRGLLADPHLPRKVASGRTEDATPCISCYNCLSNAFVGEADVSCTVNPAVGREKAWQLAPASKSKRVIVIGGGPSGLQAARVAAARGHQVTLFDSGPKLGGQLLLAAVPPRKARLGDLRDYLERQVQQAGVKIVLNRQVSAAEVMAMKPDAVVLAAGARVLVPPIAGIDGAVTAEDVLAGTAQVGARVAVIGGGMVGCETAEFLADQGKQVTVVEVLPKLARGMNLWLRRQLLDNLVEKKVTLLTETTTRSVSEKGVEVTASDGKKWLIEADTVVLAAGARSADDLWRELEGKVPGLYKTGDCVRPRGILEAMEEGYNIGRLI